ncbi:MAG TPA: DNA helicase RecQ [Chitinophagales bacterium]|jgi:ATP-dependent DNA helicase RecQ|nr:DNA helicase RecQ [Chitinophagales bacterium]HPN18134.1 DNA helicase RecQ [Chitinophagales bacterium]
MSIQPVSISGALKEYFGFEKFKGNQQAIIESILAKKDTFVIMPTGGGKSLCYQLPAIISEGTAIIVSPLIALMKNQVDLIRGYSSTDNIAHFINSQMNKAQITQVKKDITNRKCKLLYVAPESLVKQENIDFLKTIKISFVAVDEAHCISEWGHDFRPEYRKIKGMLNEIEDNIPIVALTATATPKVQSDIVKTLGMKEPEIFISSFLRDNLYYEIRPKPSKQDAIKDIIKFIKKGGNKSGIIYCLSRNSTEELAEVLQVNGINAAAYHAGLDASVRSERQDQFLMEDVDVIVATIAFGMGIDKPDVRFVIHFDIPKSLENYYQETGRAGRDGLEGICIAYFSPKEIHKFEKFILSNKEKSVAEKEIAVMQLSEVEAYCESAECRKKFVLHYFGEEMKDCGKCDNCLHPKEQLEAKEEIKLSLQVVADTNERVNIPNVINILIGRKSADITANNLDKIKIFGKGADHDMVFWNSVVRKAILLNLIEKDIEQYGVLKLTEEGKKFIKKPVSSKIVLNHKFEDGEDDEEVTLNGKSGSVLEPALMSILTGIRKTEGARLKLPPYAIFSEQSLEEMATFFPFDKEELAKMHGVNTAKAQKFGEPFLKAIKKYVEDNNIERSADFSIIKIADKNSNVKVNIIKSIDKKMPLEHIASSYGLNMEDLITELDTIVNSGTKVNINYYLEDAVDEDIQEEIYDYFMQAESDNVDVAYKKLKEEDIELREIQLVRLKFLSEVAN